MANGTTIPTEQEYAIEIGKFYLQTVDDLKAESQNVTDEDVRAAATVAVTQATRHRHYVIEEANGGTTRTRAGKPTVKNPDEPATPSQYGKIRREVDTQIKAGNRSPLGKDDYFAFKDEKLTKGRASEIIDELVEQNSE